MSLIRIQGLTKLYRMGDSIVRALDGVDLDIAAGEFVAITGASGSGKSTMMHLLGCLDRPTGGAYLLDGRNVSDLGDRELAEVRNKKIGFVFQTFNLINRTSAVDNVGVPLFYARRTNTRGPARHALERVGLHHRAHHKPSELSGGERQRVAIARAIVNEPVLLLADEPTGNLDSRTGEQIMEIFHKLNAQGVTIILVTHEPDVAIQAKRIVHMKDGRITSDRLTADILREQGGSPATSFHPMMAPAATPGSVPARSAGGDDLTTPPPALEPLSTASITPRRAPGATAALICGGLALSAYLCLVAVSLYVSQLMPKMEEGGTYDPAKLRNLPPIVFVLGWVKLLLIVLGIVLGIVAIRCGSVALNRIRNEPGFWHGRARAHIGRIFGWLAVLVPVAAIALAIFKMVTAVPKPV